MDITRRKFMLAGAGGLAVAAGVGLPLRSVAAPVKIIEINRRNASSNIEYRLIFTARSSGKTIEFPGHAYMMTGEYDHKDKLCRFDKAKILGFYPAPEASTVKTMFAFPVPGEVRADLKLELDKELITHRIDVMTAQNGYDAAAAVARNYAKQNPYQLGQTDCVSLVSAILAAVEKATQGADGKLLVPDKQKFQTPKDYLTQLMIANGQRLE